MLAHSFESCNGVLLDRCAVLDRVGGDEDLLHEITTIFLSEYPELLDDIRDAIAASDARKLERSAHSLKGAVSNFGAHAATQAAYRLEDLGRHNRLECAAVALAELETQLSALEPALIRIIQA